MGGEIQFNYSLFLSQFPIVSDFQKMPSNENDNCIRSPSSQLLHQKNGNRSVQIVDVQRLIELKSGKGLKCKEVTFPPIAEVQTEKGVMKEFADNSLGANTAQNNLKVKLVKLWSSIKVENELMKNGRKRSALYEYK